MRTLRFGTLATVLTLMALVAAAPLSAQADILQIQSQPTSVQANEAFTIIVEAFDTVAAAIDTGYATDISIQILSQTGSATLNGVLTQTPTNGVATFSGLDLDRLDSVVIRASSGALTDADTTAIAVTADQLEITTAPPASARANQTFTIVVTATDGFTIDTNFNGNIAGALSQGSGAVSGVASTGATNGEVTFATVSIDTLGADKQITFTATGLTSVTTADIAITADRLVITAGIGTTVAGETIGGGGGGITVEARDGNGNTDTTFGNGVNVTLSSGTGALSGTTTRTAAAGVATFDDLSIELIGSKQLTFDSGALDDAVSASFDITPAADAALQFGQQPTDTGVNQSITPAITVRIVDQFGNLTASGASVDLSIDNNPGTGVIGGTTTQAATAGVATFNDITIDEAGTGYTLEAASGALTVATSNAFNITANPAPTFTVTQDGNPITSGANVNALIGDTIAVLDFSITVNDASTGDNVTLAANITNIGTTGMTNADWQGNTPQSSPTPVVATPTLGTLNTAITHVITLTASDGVNADVVFTINLVVSAAPTITVTAPNGAENITIGSNFNITWSSAGAGANVEIHLSTDGGGTFPTVITASTANSGTFSWNTTGAPATTQARVRVRDIATPATFDVSDANFTLAVPAPAAVSLTAQNNPGNQTATPGSARTGLGFRLTETGGGSTFTVTSVEVNINTNNSTSIASLTSVSLNRSGAGTLATIANGGAGWSVAGNVITVTFTGLSSGVTAGGTGDFTVSLTFSGAGVPVPNPTFSAALVPGDVNGGASVTGANVNGGTITLVEQLPSDPFDDDDDDDDSCDLSTRGGPAWPVLVALVAVVLAAALRRRTA